MSIRISIRTTAPWALYWGPGPLPAGATAHGTVTRGEADTGALIRMPNGIYVQGNAGAIRSLPQREVAVSLAAASMAALAGKTKTPARTRASRVNGRSGGRPPKQPSE